VAGIFNTADREETEEDGGISSKDVCDSVFNHQLHVVGLIPAWRRLNAQSTKSQTRYLEKHLVMTAVLGVAIDFDKGFMNLGQVDSFCRRSLKPQK
jgi:hypothetical protein